MVGDKGRAEFSNVNFGVYSMLVQKDKYYTEQFDAVYANRSVALSPVIGKKKIRIVLSWPGYPLDLDLHVRFQTAQNFFCSVGPM